MLKTTRFLIATALAMLIAAPALAQSLTYVGNSSDDQLTGGDGILAFHKACDATFSGSQFCTSEDSIRGGGFPIEDEVVRVHPIVLGGDGVTAYLYIGRAIAFNDISCKAWSSFNAVDLGLVIDGFNGGRFDFESCGALRKVACCSKKGGQKGK